jgi:hypothetical protein
MLLIDVDQGMRRLPLEELVERLSRANRQLVAMAEWRSPSGKGWHQIILVEPPPRTASETVALQLLLGSDPYREAFNSWRARVVDAGKAGPYWRRRWNVLYGRVPRR